MIFSVNYAHLVVCRLSCLRCRQEYCREYSNCDDNACTVAFFFICLGRKKLKGSKVILIQSLGTGMSMAHVAAKSH